MIWHRNYYLIGSNPRMVLEELLRFFCIYKINLLVKKVISIIYTTVTISLHLE